MSLDDPRNEDDLNGNLADDDDDAGISEDHDREDRGQRDEYGHDETFDEPNERQRHDDQEPTDEDDSRGRADAGDKPPPKDGIDDELKTMAREFGMDDDDIAAFPNKRALERALLSINRTARKSSKPVEAPPAETKDGATETAKSRRYELKLSDDFVSGMDPELVNGLKGINDHYGSLVDDMSTRLERLQTYVAEQQQQQIISQFDGEIKALGDDYAEVFGTGGSLELDRTSEHYKARDALYREMESMVAGYQASHRPVPPFKTLFRRAFNSVYGDMVAQRESQAARKELRSSLERRRSSMTGRPSGRRAPTGVTGRERGMAFAEKFYKDRGISTDDYDDDEYA